MSQVMYDQEKVIEKNVFFTGTDTLREGHLLCYEADFAGSGTVDGKTGDATVFNPLRAVRAEKPSATNLQNFAGVVSAGSDGKVGPTNIKIHVPTRAGQKVNIFNSVSSTIDSTLLTLVADSFIAGGVGEGQTIAKAMQTVDRSSTNGPAQALLFGTNPAEAYKSGAAGGTGPSPLIWDQIPWNEINNDPSLGFTYWEDYLHTIDVTTADGYVVTAVTSGAIAPVVTEPGGVLLADSAGNASADDGVNVQLTNCMVLPAAGVKIAFEARVKMNDTSALISQFYIGLAGIDTTLIASGVVDDTVDKAAWFRHGATTGDRLSTILSITSEQEITADQATVADDTYIKLGIVIDGLTSVKFYADGVLVETSTTTASIPNKVMCLSYVAQTEGASKDAELSVDWVRIASVGGRAA